MAVPANSKVASRYARAIFEHFPAAEKEKVCEELSQFAKLMAENSDLQRALTVDVFPLEKKRQVIEDLVKKLNFAEGTKKSLLVLCEMRRLREMASISQELRSQILDAKGVVPIQVEHASKLSQDEMTKIQQKFKALLGKEVDASFVHEPSLVGGVRVTAKGKTYDGSLSGWLTSFEERLLA